MVQKQAAMTAAYLSGVLILSTELDGAVHGKIIPSSKHKLPAFIRAINRALAVLRVGISLIYLSDILRESINFVMASSIDMGS